jgi:HNH endonuclease
MSQMRKLCIDGQLFLIGKKTDVNAFKNEIVWVPKEYHQEMAGLLLTSFMHSNQKEKSTKSLPLEVKDEFGTRISWRAHLASSYQGCHRPRDYGSKVSEVRTRFKVANDDTVWEPIIGEWMKVKLVTAAHIVPRSQKDVYIRFLFGVEDHVSFLMDARNKLFMLDCLEKAFDRGEFIIVPTGDFDESGQVKLQCRVVRPGLLSKRGGTHTLVYRKDEDHPELTMDDIHERILTFPKETQLRPYRRCLFHHAIGAVMLCRNLRLNGWEEIWSDFFSGRIWATPEKYLERSLLQATWDLVLGGKMPIGLEQFSFRGLGGVSEADSQMWASEVMAKVVKETEDKGDEEDEEDHESEEDMAEDSDED